MKELLQSVIRKEGHDRQIIKAVEELSELQKELCKMLLYNEDSRRSNIIEEVGDVDIMLTQIKLMFDCEEEVEVSINKKLEKLRGKYGG